MLEKKFLVKKIPDVIVYESGETKSLNSLPCKGIQQWYITKKDDSVVNRLRLYEDGNCIFEIKRGYSISRDIGWKVKFEDFKDIIKYTSNLSFDRYIIVNDDDFIITLDMYKENLQGLCLLEVKGKGEDSFTNVFNWKIPESWDWVDKEVTNDQEYENVTIAEKNMISSKNIEVLYNIIDDVLREDLREEAKEIADNLDDKGYSEIKMYYDTDNLNAVCMHFDNLKNKMIKKGIMTMKEGDELGYDFDCNSL